MGQFPSFLPLSRAASSDRASPTSSRAAAIRAWQRSATPKSTCRFSRATSRGRAVPPRRAAAALSPTAVAGPWAEGSAGGTQQCRARQCRANVRHHDDERRSLLTDPHHPEFPRDRMAPSVKSRSSRSFRKTTTRRKVLSRKSNRRCSASRWCARGRAPLNSRGDIRALSRPISASAVRCNTWCCRPMPPGRSPRRPTPCSPAS